MGTTRTRSAKADGVVRYAVVGLGHIAQVAVIPAFAHAKTNSKLVAVVSGDAKKRRALERRHRGLKCYSYAQYDRCLSDGIDAVYIALPNKLHCEYAIRAADAGVHVLCEKPMAVTEQECQRMIGAAERNNVKLMIAYRLHFEAASLAAIDKSRARQFGEARLFNSVFTMQVKPDDIRLERELGGGTLYDIGIYCINAARSLFRAEPTEVVAFSSRDGDKRFREVDEMTAGLMRFPGDRLATFTSSFGASYASAYDVIGTKGRLRANPAYEYAEGLQLELAIDGRTTHRYFGKRDQFAPELVYFSDCILKNRQPEPSGQEGLADVRIIRALYRSAASGKAIRLPALHKRQGPSKRQRITRPPVRKPPLTRARSASQ